ncbi:MAG: EamA family transporter [Ignavibacteria bacterium]|jgi:drug/metabolite transporter (DMT)-like permease
MNWLPLAFLSAALSATAAIFEKKALFKLGALEFSFLISLFGAVFALPFYLTIDFASLSITNLTVLYIKTIFGTLAFLNVMYAIKNLEISNALPLIVLTPGIVAITAFFLLGDQLSSLEIIGMLLLLIGTYTLEANNRSLLEPFQVFYKSKDHRYIVFALLLFTITSVMDRLLVSNLRMPPFTFMAFQQSFQLINFFILMLVFRKGFSVGLAGSGKSTLIIVITIAALTIIYRWSQIEAVKLAPVALVLSVKRTSVFFTSAIGGKIFKESNLIRRIIATCIMIAGALFIINN